MYGFSRTDFSFSIENNNYYNSGVSYPNNYDGVYVDFSVNLR